MEVRCGKCGSINVYANITVIQTWSLCWNYKSLELNELLTSYDENGDDWYICENCGEIDRSDITPLEWWNKSLY